MTVAVSSIEGVAAPLVTANINTDVIVRIERLAEHGRGELAPFAFEAWRFDEAGNPTTGFVLNAAPFDAARILIAGRNFGCGSSREGAVWALQDFGIGCVIAPSFGDIFHNNCFQNGLLPVVLPQHEVEALAREAATGGIFRVDLRTQSLRSPAGRVLDFNVDPVKRLALLEGRDEISLTLNRTAEIDRFQHDDRLARPWIYELPST